MLLFQDWVEELNFGYATKCRAEIAAKKAIEIWGEMSYVVTQKNNNQWVPVVLPNKNQLQQGIWIAHSGIDVGVFRC